MGSSGDDDAVKICEITIQGETVKLVSMSEIPRERLSAVVDSDGPDTMLLAIELVKLGLMDPSFFDKVILEKPVSYMFELLDKWSFASRELDRAEREKERGRGSDG